MNVLHCHTPDLQTPIEETEKAFDEVYKQGKFKKARDFHPAVAKLDNSNMLDLAWSRELHRRTNREMDARLRRERLRQTIRLSGPIQSPLPQMRGRYNARSKEVRHGIQRVQV